MVVLLSGEEPVALGDSALVGVRIELPAGESSNYFGFLPEQEFELGSPQSVQADLKLTVDDVLKGVLVVGLVIGVIYLVSGPTNR